jgi:ADP-heptose:LPS heptosyltransferase
MADPQKKIPAEKILVVMPNWLGDGVMATPFLRALRSLYPAAEITALHLPLLQAVVAGLPFIDRAKEMPPRARRSGRTDVMTWLQGERFDLAVVLPNSFRSAWIAWRARIPRRVGYARDGRGRLLTDRLPPVPKSPDQRQRDRACAFARHLIGSGAPRERSPQLLRVVPIADPPGLTSRFRWTYRCEEGEEEERTSWVPFPLPGTRDRGRYQPIPTIDYYLEVARYLGAESGRDARRMELCPTAADEEEGARVLAGAGIDPGEPRVVLVPGASFGSSKCWLPERFGRLADRLMDPRGEFGAAVVLAASPAEKEIIERIQQASSLSPPGQFINLLEAHNGAGAGLGALKAIVRGSRLMIGNDTGPRHFAAALGVPVVTLFGPTDPRWAEMFWEKERQVRIDVPCGPCQLKRCPIDHRCMTGITVERVLQAARDLWGTEA